MLAPGIGLPIVYRVSFDGRRFERLARLANMLTAGEPAIDRSGNLYTFAGDAHNQTRLYRIARGKINELHRFDDRFSLGAPMPDSFGIAGIVNDPQSCAETAFVIDRTGKYRTLVDENSGNAGDGCFHSGFPHGPLTVVRDGFLSLNVHQVIRLKVDGRRTVLAELPRTLGRFVGSAVSGNRGRLFALSASSYGPVCTRLLEIDGRAIRTIRSFTRHDDRCVRFDLWLAPRLDRHASQLMFATSPEDGCAAQWSLGRRSGVGTSCGSLIAVDENGTLDFVHDFAQNPAVTDTGSPFVSEKLTGAFRALKFRFERSPPGPKPFTIDLSQLRIVMIGTSGVRRIIHGTGILTSTRNAQTAPPTDSADVADASYELPIDLPEDMYAVRFTSTTAVKDADGEPLGVQTKADPPSVFVPPSTNSELDALRKRYLGKRVFGTDGLHLNCPDAFGRPFSESVASAYVTDVERDDADAYIRGDEYAGIETFQIPFLSLDPIVVTLSIDPSDRRLMKSRGYTCRSFVLIAAGVWEIERKFSLRPPIDRLWPRQFRDAIARGVPIVGMSHRMVATIWGYPGVYGTVKQLDALPVWTFPGGGPFIASATFEGDRATAIRLFGNLP